MTLQTPILHVLFLIGRTMTKGLAWDIERESLDRAIAQWVVRNNDIAKADPYLKEYLTNLNGPCPEDTLATPPEVGHAYETRGIIERLSKGMVDAPRWAPYQDMLQTLVDQFDVSDELMKHLAVLYTDYTARCVINEVRELVDRHPNVASLWKEASHLHALEQDEGLLMYEEVTQAVRSILSVTGDYGAFERYLPMPEGTPIVPEGEIGQGLRQHLVKLLKYPEQLKQFDGQTWESFSQALARSI